MSLYSNWGFTRSRSKAGDGPSLELINGAALSLSGMTLIIAQTGRCVHRSMLTNCPGRRLYSHSYLGLHCIYTG